MAHRATSAQPYGPSATQFARTDPQTRSALEPRSRASARRQSACLAATAMGLLLVSPALGQRLENKVAVFAALDKVTARISKLEVPLNETTNFGSLRLTPRVCFTRPATEQPKTSTFVEVDETLLSGEEKRLFAGWMFAESTGLNAVEHPVFDIWLTDCKDPLRPVPQTASAAGAGPGKAAPQGGITDEPPRRRVRR